MISDTGAAIVCLTLGPLLIVLGVLLVVHRTRWMALWLRFQRYLRASRPGDPRADLPRRIVIALLVIGPFAIGLGLWMLILALTYL